MSRIRLTPSAVLLLACASAPNFDPADHAQYLRDANVLMQKGEVDEGLIITDRVLAEDPENRDARLMAARGSLSLADRGRSNTPGLIADGIHNYELALEQDDHDPDTWVALSRAYLLNGQFEDGREAAVVPYAPAFASAQTPTPS